MITQYRAVVRRVNAIKCATSAYSTLSHAENKELIATEIARVKAQAAENDENLAKLKRELSKLRTSIEKNENNTAMLERNNGWLAERLNELESIEAMLTLPITDPVNVQTVNTLATSRLADKHLK